jgi:glycosyltransferase involved in cell wall biosynthesis
MTDLAAVTSGNGSADKRLYFDMTEALMAFGGQSVQYYGIARTVYEVGKSLARMRSDIDFVVYSFAYQRFFKIAHEIDGEGQVSFLFPTEFSQRKMRTIYGSRALTRLSSWLHGLWAGRNRKVWDVNTKFFAPIELTPGVLVSLARPKLMVDLAWAIEQQKWPVKLVPLLHDLMPLYKEKRRRFSSFSRNFLNDNRYLITHSATVLTNSAFTRDEVLHFAKQGYLPSPKQMSPVPLVQYCPEGNEPPVLELPQSPFILSVGPNLGNKNIELTFQALQQLHREGRPIPEFVIAGNPRRQIREYLAKADFDPVRHKIRFIGNPTQTDLVRLYRGALALVIPSRMEGWGLPAGEALWLGTPVISSTAPALKEVCGDLALYVDPDDAKGLADAIDLLSRDAAGTAALKARIHAASPTFRTWDTVSSDLLGAVSPLIA